MLFCDVSFYLNNLATKVYLEKRTNSENETFIRIKAGKQANLFGKDCIYVSSLCSDSDFMDLFRVCII